MPTIILNDYSIHDASNPIGSYATNTVVINLMIANDGKKNRSLATLTCPRTPYVRLVVV